MANCEDMQKNSIPGGRNSKGKGLRWERAWRAGGIAKRLAGLGGGEGRAGTRR